MRSAPDRLVPLALLVCEDAVAAYQSAARLFPERENQAASEMADRAALAAVLQAIPREPDSILLGPGASGEATLPKRDPIGRCISLDGLLASLLKAILAKRSGRDHLDEALAFHLLKMQLSVDSWSLGVSDVALRPEPEPTNPARAV